MSAVSPPGGTCADALEFDGTPETPYIVNLDTTAYADDPTLSTSPPLVPVPPAYNAAWFKVTPAITGRLFVTTVHSDYDTQMSILQGTCGASPLEWVLIASNDNDGLLFTSVLDEPVTGGQEYYIVVAGVGPGGGHLAFGAQVIFP